MTAETQRAYFETARALGSAAKLRVWAGLEQDTFAPDALKAENRRAADYVIGSAHYVSLNFHGRTVAVEIQTDVGAPSAVYRRKMRGRRA